MKLQKTKNQKKVKFIIQMNNKKIFNKKKKMINKFRMKKDSSMRVKLKIKNLKKKLKIYSKMKKNLF